MREKSIKQEIEQLQKSIKKLKLKRVAINVRYESKAFLHVHNEIKGMEEELEKLLVEQDAI